mmetsp:Transcript_12603/g.29592  ORF Transcript_12603/g.29592 Transcript_12603/m.29592 type:complete len:263 (-) Transcript_12603:80-868(-)
MPQPADVALFEAAKDRERPLFLRGEWRRAPPKDDPDARVLMATTALRAKAGGAAERTGEASGRRRPRQAGNARRSASANPGVPTRPLSPTSHLRKLTETVQQYMEVKPCDEYVRNFWLPPEIPTHQRPLEDSALKALRNFGTKQQAWGKRPTDYRTSNWYVENQWSLRALQQSQSEPLLGRGAESAPDPRSQKQPGLKSAGVKSIMVGGNGGGLSGRNVGLYEDSFQLWGAGSYTLPAHGLSSTDATRANSLSAADKLIMRS